MPALNMTGAALNVFAATGLPLRNTKFAVVFHGPAIDGILDDAHYQAKRGVANPNLKVLAELTWLTRPGMRYRWEAAMEVIWTFTSQARDLLALQVLETRNPGRPVYVR